jgi:4-amino-4-deoxy-L-arabinose transferase-like glycosyltransferase
MIKDKEQNKNRPAIDLPLKNNIQANSNLYYAMLAVMLITIIAYSSSLFNGFVWDDDSYIRNNPLVQSFNLPDIFSSFSMGNYHPLTMFSLAIEYKLFGLNEAGFHVVSLVLHLLNVFLVFNLILRLTGQFQIAIVASLLFGIHPMHVESVAWISERKDLLYSAFFLVALIYYVKFTQNETKKYYFLSLLFFLLSLLSKGKKN